MKKIIFILFMLSFSYFTFSQDRDSLVSYLRDNCSLWSDYERANDMIYYSSMSLYDDVFLVLGLNTKFSKSLNLFVTDSKTFAISPSVATQWDNSISNNKISNLALFISDFDFDERNDIIGINEGELNLTHLSIYSVYKETPLLEVDMLDYYEYQFSWVDYCIVNGTRGIRIKVRGKALTKEEYFYLVGDVDNYNVYQGEEDNYAFYYWSPSEQRYILDETVTQEQLENAHCPDDYFAYNGLKFSKLDSKLTAEDLQDLDKAQLRLMRNAVYARHGRTFKSVDLQSLWNCYTWYKVNPNYSDELLTDIDKYNIKLIQQYEAQR